MNKGEIVNLISKRTGLTKLDCGRCMNEFIKIVKEGLNKGEAISIKEFGRWEVKRVKEKKLYNPIKNKYIFVKAKNVPSFKVSKEFVITLI